MTKPTDEQIAMLDPEELAALNAEDPPAGDDGEEDDEDLTMGTPGQDDDDDGDDQDGDDDGDGDDGDDDDDAPGRDDGAEDDADQPTGKDDDAGDDGAAASAYVPIEVPQAVTERLAAIDAEIDAIEAKFDEGDLTTAERRAETRKLENEARDLRDQKARIETRNEIQHQRVMESWMSDVSAFAEANPAVRATEYRWKSFDEFVRKVTADPEHQNLSNRKQLALAYKEFSEALGLEGAESKPAADKGRKPKPQNKRDKTTLPPTLHNMPAADIETADTGKYGQLNRLMNSRNPKDVARATDMMESMSESERNQYLRSKG